MRRPLTAWLLLAAIGCAGVAPPRAARHRHARSVAAAAPTVADANVMRIGVASTGLSPTVLEVGPREGAVRRYIVHGHALELEGDVTRSADWSLAEGTWRVLRAADGWRFISETGVWASPSFLGPLHLVVSSPEGVLGHGVGRVVTLRNGRLEGAPLPPSVVIDAAFADDARGVALIEPGVAFVTGDAGQHWTLAPPFEETVREVAADVEGLWLIGATRARVHRSNGTQTVVDVAGAPRTFEPAEPEAARPRNLLDFREVEHLTTFLDTSQRTAVARIGTWHTSHEAIYDLVDDRIVGPFEPPPRCRLGSYQVADRLYAVCDQDGGWALLARGDDGAWAPRLTFRACGEAPTCAVSPDGRRVACEGRCSEQESCAAGTTVCEQIDHEPPRSRVVGGRVPRWSIAGWDGDELVLLDERRFASHAMALRGSGPRVLLMANEDRARYRIHGSLLRLGRDGLLRVTATTSDTRESVVLEGRPGGRFVAREAPSWATTPDLRGRVALCSADGDLGAVAPDGGIWFSTHLERAWHSLQAGGYDPYLTALRGSPGNRGELSCSSTGWSAGPTGIGWGRPVQSGHNHVGLGRGVPQFLWEREPTDLWQCAPDGDPSRPTDDQPDPEPAALPGAEYESDSSSWFNGRFWVRESPAIPQRTSYAFPWQMRATGHRRPRITLVEFRHDRALVLAPSNDSRSIETLVELSANTSPRILWRAPYEHDPYTTALVARDGTTVAVRLRRFGDHRGLSPTVVVSSQRAGVRAASIAVAARAEGTVGVYAAGVDGGFLRILDDGTALGGPPGEVPRVLATRISLDPCVSSAMGDYVVETGASVTGVDDRAVDMLLEAHFSRAGDALCLRALAHFGTPFTIDARGARGPWGRSTALRCSRPTRLRRWR